MRISPAAAAMVVLMQWTVVHAEGASPADALYREGVAAEKAGDHVRAAELWEKAVAADPNHANSHYNLGQHHQLHGEAAAQLKHFLAAHKLLPGDLRAAEKVVQSYYRLAQYREAAPYRDDVLELIKSSPDPAIAAKKEFCIDQFPIGDDRFMVFETVNGPDRWRIYGFKLVRQGTIVKSINLETSDAQPDAGLHAIRTPYVLAEWVGRAGHTIFSRHWKTIPPYDELKTAVLEAHAGRVSVEARFIANSRPAPATKRGPSTPAERAAFVKAVKRLENDPLAPTAAADRARLMNWVEQAPDFNVVICRVIYPGMQGAHGTELFGQFVLASAASMVGEPRTAGDADVVYLAGLEGALHAYQAILVKEPQAHNQFFDELADKAARGKLPAYVKAAGCPAP